MTSPEPERLAQVELFRGLSHDDRKRLASWLTVEEFDVGRSPVRTGDSGYAFFILEEGRARCELDGQVVEILEPGSVFGEMALFNADGRRTATVIPETPIRVLYMFGTRFREMQMQMPEVAARLQQLFDERVARDESLKGE
jgi:CRP-like cAMP-binding protein